MLVQNFFSSFENLNSIKKTTLKHHIDLDTKLYNLYNISSNKNKHHSLLLKNRIVFIKTISILNFLMIISLINYIISNNVSANLTYSKINLKIQGNGLLNVYNTFFNSTPDEIYIEGIKQDVISCKYNFSRTNNSIELN